MDVGLVLRAAANATAGNSTSEQSGNSDSGGRPPVYKAVGIILAVCSGLFIGTSFVLKKHGLLKANLKYSEEAGEGYGYLKNAWWWSGMTLMIVGEICNFVAYAFTDAILVTPLGALSVVVTTILSAIFLKERLSFVGKVGCFLCIVGSVVIVLNTPAQSSVNSIQDMQHFVIAPGFLSYAGVVIVGCSFIAWWAGPRYGKKSMLVYLSICSLIGGLSVVATQGLGAAIVTQIGGTPQFNQWFIYVLLVFVIATLLTEIIFLNKALNIFNAALVTPTYYVYFTSATIVTSAILFRGFKGTVVEIITIVMGFLEICAGVVLLQLSKSAKDVPDSAVFKGDLDQVRTVAEQEEQESEPKADAIRGASALIRSFSKSKRGREIEEAKRVHEDRMEPIGEDEVVEWDGLRRRKTTISSTHSPIRAKTMHPPLGLTHFPGPEDEVEDDGPTVFRRAMSILNPRRNQSPDRKGPSTANVALDDMEHDDSNDTAGPLPFPQYQYNIAPGLKRETSLGLSGLQEEDTSYRSPAVQWGDKSRSSSKSSGFTAAPTPPPHRDLLATAKRQFSFQNVFSRHGRSTEDLNRPTTSESKLSYIGFKRQPSLATPTEEERLGLVTGDSRQSMSGGPGVTGGDMGATGTMTLEPEDVSDNGVDDDRSYDADGRDDVLEHSRDGRRDHYNDGRYHEDMADSDDEAYAAASSRDRHGRYSGASDFL